ncbi:MAG: lactate permease LctP family transporter [Gemmataceae bacterium]|nr:lactate permease LctP family transporter [Gemmataceae bacterium]
MIWTQTYDPLGNLWLSTLVAALPVILLMSLLASGRVTAHMAALAGLLAALVLAIFVYVPEQGGLSYAERVTAWLPTMLAAAGNGAAFGLLPIGWIVLMAIFLYSLTVTTGQFEIVKHSVAALSDDRRIQALLIAFSFGAFIEGAAGFGTPVAISAALMMGAGFKPLYAAGLALLANTSPVAFGALGTPIITLAQVTGLEVLALSQMAGRQLPIFSLIVPAWLVWVMAGWRGVVGVWPALVVCGGSFALVQFLVANLHGPWLVDVTGGLISLVSLALFLKIWQPAQTWHFADEARDAAAAGAVAHSRRQILSAWVPWLLLTIFVFVWGLPQVKGVLGTPGKAHKDAFVKSDETVESHPTFVMVKVPALHQRIARDAPVVREREVERAIYELNWLSATGTGILFAAVLSAVWMGISPARFLAVFAATCWKMRWPLFTIACMLAIAFTTRYSGMDATLGLAFTRTGWLYPLFAAMLGWLGVALTGSDTSSNALFGSLQTITAGQLVEQGVLPLSDTQAKVLLAAANSTGGVMGKMIDAQSIVVAAVATGQHNQEGPILRFVFWHSLVLALLMGVLVLLQAYVFPWMIP